MPIITGSTTTSFSKFSIENLSISNLNAFSSLDFTADPGLFGLDVESKFVSGKINQSTLNFDSAASCSLPARTQSSALASHGSHQTESVTPLRGLNPPVCLCLHR